MECVTFLVHHGADVNTRNKNGETPLYCAIDYNCPKEYVTSLVHHGADVRSKNNRGETIEDAAKARSPTVLLPRIQAAFSAVAMSAFFSGINRLGGFKSLDDSFGHDGQDDLKKYVYGMLKELNSLGFVNVESELLSYTQ